MKINVEINGKLWEVVFINFQSQKVFVKCNPRKAGGNVGLHDYDDEGTPFDEVDKWIVEYER